MRRFGRSGALLSHRGEPGPRRLGQVPWLALIGLVIVGGVAGSTVAGAAQHERTVHVVDISGEIDLGIVPYLDRALEEAEEAGADAVVLVVDTPGGRLDAVLRMQAALLETRVRTITFVDGMALSAGALITIATEEIYLAPGSPFGAATPVVGDTGELADEKTISAVRGTFRATADARGRDPRVAEAMVDPDVEVDGLVERGSLLTLDPAGALEWGYSEGTTSDIADLLAAADLAGADLVDTSPSLAESLVRFLTNPVLASILITLAIWLIIGDLVSGGVGVATAVAVLLFAIFFWGHLLAGLTGWEDVALVVVGLALIALELLVFPGLGLPGLLGAGALLAGLFMAQLSRDLITGEQIRSAAVSVGVTFLAALVGLIVAVRFLSRYGPPRPLVLQTQLGMGEGITERATGGWIGWFGGRDLVLEGAGGDRAEDGDDASEAPALVGREGVALSDLRPSGIADIDGERVDVVTAGEYIERGEGIEVVRDDGYRRVVRRARAVT